MKAAIYVRQSLDKLGSGAAVGRQIAECTELVERHGWQTGEVYRDNDRSATTGHRPGWRRLLADLAEGRHDVLVCWHTDRLYRRLRDLADLLDIAEQRSLRIVTVKASELDLSTPAGRMLAGMLGAAARYEVEQKGARQVAANRARAQGGVVLWTRRPFGFDREGHQIRVRESEATEIRKAADAILDGASLASVAADLNARGVPTSTGGQWRVAPLKRVLLNPRVAGRVVYRDEDMGDGGPVVLAPEKYERLKALLTDPRRRNAPSTAVKHLLSGIVRCGRDGCDLRPMLFTTNSAEKVPVYRCTRCYMARHRDRVDDVVLVALIDRLGRADAAQLIAPDVDLDALRLEVTELRNRRDGLAALLADGLLGPEAVREQARRLTEQIGELERKMRTVTGDSPLSSLVGVDDIAAVLNAMPLTHLRELIRSLCIPVILPAGKGVRFHPEQVHVDWLR